MLPVRRNNGPISFHGTEKIVHHLQYSLQVVEDIGVWKYNKFQGDEIRNM